MKLDDLSIKVAMLYGTEDFVVGMFFIWNHLVVQSH